MNLIPIFNTNLHSKVDAVYNLALQEVLELIDNQTKE